MEALDLMKETLRIGESVFRTPHHSELIQFMSNAQDVLRFQGQLEEAEKMARRSLEATVNEWGEEHLKAAASRGQLKDILWDLDDADGAEEIAKENLRIMAKSPYSTDISRIDDIALLLDTLSGRQMTKQDDSRNERIQKYANEALALVDKLKKQQASREKEIREKKGLQGDFPGPLMLPSSLQDLI